MFYGSEFEYTLHPERRWDICSHVPRLWQIIDWVSVSCTINRNNWRDGREAEGAPLLREYGVYSSIEGSNPSLSAILFVMDFI